jgi:hypothetical protein
MDDPLRWIPPPICLQLLGFPPISFVLNFFFFTTSCSYFASLATTGRVEGFLECCAQQGLVWLPKSLERRSFRTRMEREKKAKIVVYLCLVGGKDKRLSGQSFAFSRA